MYKERFPAYIIKNAMGQDGHETIYHNFIYGCYTFRIGRMHGEREEREPQEKRVYCLHTGTDAVRSKEDDRK